MASGRHRNDCTCEKCTIKRGNPKENYLTKEDEVQEQKIESPIVQQNIEGSKIKSDHELTMYATCLLQPLFEKFTEEFIRARQSIINQEGNLNLKLQDVQNQERYLKERTNELNMRLSEKIESFNRKITEYQSMCNEISVKLEQAKKNEAHIEHKLQQTADIIERNKQDRDILNQKMKDIESKEREYQAKLKILNQKG